MAVADIIFAISIMPQIIYMIIYWNSTLINYNPYVMAITGSPLPIFLKISSGLHAGAATERILALYFPILYRKMDHVDCSNLLMLISVLLGFIDTVLAMCTFEYEPHLNCSSIGCMVNDLFRTYWGASNMTCGIIIVVMSVFVFFKVQKLERESGTIGGNSVQKVPSSKSYDMWHPAELPILSDNPILAHFSRRDICRIFNIRSVWPNLCGFSAH
ncbi:G_PROTEIN_RECEP_F1_2 domain-containing protein [Caenorhabditis elegans]|uniref:G_PROTEIN_RECEP_F1_2 domain-containing protein n=1 Tax=Caenorhabditis elegans TaxID=6239 RepID=O62494_CAEEL|nr:G_PROTEIN_RECEP_F1_2 domain-containing protein [Caenorhabditis elegans]CAA19552.3 G_PROTEIN_RECEP_F1_2 domain-containing protein [Caenorhabditis elegans]|eukprot:NP_496643.2 Uncharacterized protein CELE_Y57A10C.10 [Caenorhabditis elegans]